MRIASPSGNWNVAAEAAFRIFRGKIYFKKTNVLDAALSSGTWIEGTPYCSDSIFPNQQMIEYEIGQFTTNSVSVTARFNGIPGIPEVSAVQYFKNNIFNATDYIEAKITGSIGISRGTMSTDVCNTFSGFVDKNGVNYDNENDEVTFTIRTPQDVLDESPSYSATTQYLNGSVDGAGMDGLVLPAINGVYITDSAITDFVMSVGEHVITFDYNGGTEQAKLDDGDYVTLPTSAGTATLVNGNGREKVEIYVDPSDFINYENEVSNRFVVVEKGATIPNQWFVGLSVKQTLKNLFDQIGSVSVEYSTLRCNSATGSGKVSFVDIPQDAIAKKLFTLNMPMVAVGDDLYIATGDKVWLRNWGTGYYTEIAALGNVTDRIEKMIYSSAEDDIWIYYKDASDNNYARKYDVTGATLSSAVSLGGTSILRYCIALFDADDKYGLIYTDGSNVKFLDGSAMTVSTLFTAADLGYGTGDLLMNFAYTSSNYYRFFVDDGGTIKVHQISRANPDWLDGGLYISSAIFNYNEAALHVSEDVIYFYSPGLDKVRAHASNSATISDVQAVTGAVAGFLYANSVVYFLEYSRTSNIGNLYSAVSGAPTLLSSEVRTNTYFGLAFTNSRLFGIDMNRRLWMYHTTVEWMIPEGLFEGLSIRGAIDAVCKSYHLTWIFSANKNIFVYLRGNDSGVIQTTGNNLVLNKTNIVSISRSDKAIIKADWVEVSNEDVTYNYNGTDYNVVPAPNEKQFSVSSVLINDLIVQDLTKLMFTFFNIDHDIYRIKTNVARMEYEAMDGADITLSDSRVQLTDTGLMQMFGINADGSVECEVII